MGIDCPFCPRPSSGKGKWRLGIEIGTGRTNCWSCGSHRLYETLALASNTSVPQIAVLFQGIRFKKLETPVANRGDLKLPTSIGEMKQVHLDYLSSRGFDPEGLSLLWKVRGISISSRGLSWRLFIPIYLDRELVSWTTRSLVDKEGVQRYISAPTTDESLPIKHTLYGLDLARSTVIVCEGPIDCWRIGPGAVATFGTAYTREQVGLIARFPKRVICFDNESRAQTQAWKLASELSALPGETLHVCLDAKDPGDASDEEIMELREML